MATIYRVVFHSPIADSEELVASDYDDLPTAAAEAARYHASVIFILDSDQLEELVGEA